MTVDARKNKPDRVQSITQLFLLRFAFDEFLYCLQFVFTARLKSPGVVENKAMIVCEGEFVIDVVFAALHRGLYYQLPPRLIISQSNLYRGVESSLARR